MHSFLFQNNISTHQEIQYAKIIENHLIFPQGDHSPVKPVDHRNHLIFQRDSIPGEFQMVTIPN